MAGASEDEVRKKIRKESTCVKCNVHIRKTTGTSKFILSREDAQQFYEDYRYYVQIYDVICSKCYCQLRVQKSKQMLKVKQKESCNLQQNELFNDRQDTLSHNLQDVPDEVSKSLIKSDQTDDSSEQNTPSNQSESQSSVTGISQSSNDSPYVPIENLPVEMVSMPFPRTILSHKYCFLCKSVDNLQDVPFHARIQAFTKRKIFIPRRNRCCKTHLIKNRFYEEDLLRITIYDQECLIESTEIMKFMNYISNKVDASLHNKIGEYELSEERVKALTGYNWENIFVLRNLTTTIRNSENRSITQALIIFLFKLKSGVSNQCIAAILDITETVVENAINSILKCFETVILPSHFGTHTKNRDFFLGQTAAIASKLHNLSDHLAIICDATYLQHGKSSNNAYQRKSYSGQKKKHLCKPFTICTTNGYIVDIAGPFNANKNDAQILEYLLSLPGGLNSILKEGDIFILDRGFRDVKPLLESKGFIVLMPALKGHRNQLTVEEANESRLVTKLRWVVEAIHGIIGQKCKLLHHQLHNSLLPKSDVYCKIACFLQNLFGKRLNSDYEKNELIIDRINKTKDLTNTLADEVETNNWNRKSVPFKIFSSQELLDFPEMTIEDLKILFAGTYQLAQSVSYLAEMLNDDESLTLSYLKINPDIIRFEVKSRHINSKTYKCYVHYQKDTVGISGIKRYCCTCANGNRTIGCCSHVAALIYYLTHARYLSRTVRPAEKLTTLFDFENIVTCIDEDSDQD